MRTQLTALALIGFCIIGFTTTMTAQTKPSKAVNQEVVSAPVEPSCVFEEPLRPPYTDPFFPTTKRLPYRKEPEKTVVAVDPKTVMLDQIVLKGVSGPVGRRLALINNYTFAAGESGMIRVPKGNAKIEVLEVKERSAIIKVENDPEPKEIFLRPEP